MTSPSPAPPPKFRYRQNADGTWDSICLLCFQTAASAEHFADLAVLEGQHECTITLDVKKPVR
jgi:hypothetical protein